MGHLSPHPVLTAEDAEGVVRQAAFTPLCDGDVGVELEWLTFRTGDRSRRLDLTEVQDLITSIGILPHGGALSIEPGGQLELSSRPQRTTADACRVAADDLYAVDTACQQAGVDLVALGMDPVREPERIVTDVRYVAMQEHFDRSGPAGRTMMTNTASIQINVGLGAGREAVRRWHVAHRTGPVLLAAFANSPVAGGVPTGWCSNRMRTWWAIDPSRTAPVSMARSEDPDPAAAFARYALDANVLLIRDGERRHLLEGPLSMRAWIEQGHPSGWPTAEALRYHLTTLFPPIRPKGWLELRQLDSLPTPFWHVAMAVASALLDDPRAADEALEATEAVADSWTLASRLGLTDPALAEAADRCFAAAADALDRAGADDATSALVDAYRERYVSRRRTPADDRLDALFATGSLHPEAESPIRYVDLEAAWR